MSKAVAKALFLSVSLSFVSVATAQDYPQKPVRIVIPFTAGGAMDNIIRTLGPSLERDLGQTVIVENRPGGGAQIAVSALKNAPADGYTLFVGGVGQFAINPTLYKNLQYQPTTDFDGVATLLSAPMVMYSNSGNAIHSTETFKQAMKGGDIDYASVGAGTAPHILGYRLSRQNPEAKFTHIPYKGMPAVVNAILANEVDITFDAVPGVLALARSGKITPLGLAASKRSSFFPDTPTMAEHGQSDMEMDFWVAVVAKKGTPTEIIQRLHAAFESALTEPATLKKFTDQGYSRFVMSPGELNAYIASEVEKYRPIIIASGAKVD